MSSDSNAALTFAYETITYANYASYGIATLVFYEHLVSFKYEANLLSNQKWNFGTWIFVLNRYLLLAYVLFTMLSVGPPICNNAQAMNFLVFLTETMGEVPTHIFTILRTIALLQTRVWKLSVTGVMVALFLALFALGTYGDSTEAWAYLESPIAACYQIGFSISESALNRLKFADAACGIVSAAIALVVTLSKTVHEVRQAAAHKLWTTSKVLLRDGSIFFFFILCFDITNLIPLNNGVVSNESIAVSSLVNPLLSVLPKILLSRFIINLRRVDSSFGQSSNRQSLSISDPNFRMPTFNEAMDNLGEPLDFVEYCVDSEEDALEDLRDSGEGSGEDAAAELQSAANT